MVTIKEGMSLLAIQDLFNAEFPYLKLGFFRSIQNFGVRTRARVFLKPELVVSTNQRGTANPEVVIHDGMMVSEVESLFREHFGLLVQVFRKSGKSWLETKLTNDWSLKKQNEQGMELNAII